MCGLEQREIAQDNHIGDQVQFSSKNIVVVGYFIIIESATLRYALATQH